MLFTPAELDAMKERTFTMADLGRMAAGAPPRSDIPPDIMAAATRSVQMEQEAKTARAAEIARAKGPHPSKPERLLEAAWNAGPGAIIHAVRNKSTLGEGLRDAEILNQYDLARKAGELPDWLKPIGEKLGRRLTPEELEQDKAIYAEMIKRANAAIAARQSKPLLGEKSLPVRTVGAVLGEEKARALNQIAAGNQIPMPESQGLAEKAADVVGSVGGFGANLALTKQLFPELPPALQMEATTELQGEAPGTGLAMAGIMGVAGKLAGVGEKGYGELSAGKRVLRRLGKAGIESVGFGGQSAAQGASPEEIAASVLIPWLFTASDSLKGIYGEARKAELKKLFRAEVEINKTVPKEAVTIAEKWIDQWEPQTAGTSVGAEVPTVRRMGAIVGRATEAPIMESVAAAGERPPISTRNTDTATVRAAMGLPPIPQTESVPIAERQARWEAQAITPEEVDAKALLIVSGHHPQALLPHEEAGFAKRIEGVQHTYDELVDRGRGLAEGTPEYQANLEARKAQRTLADRLTEATHTADTSWSFIGLARQNLNRVLQDETSTLRMEARAEETKGGKLTNIERRDIEEHTREVRERVERAGQRRQKVTERQANRAIHQAKGSRYAKMAETEKDAELADLIKKLKENPENADQLLYQAAMNLSSRPRINGVSDVAARLQSDFDQINRYSLSDAIVRATERRARETKILGEDLNAMLRERGTRKEARTDVNLRTAIKNVLWHLSEGTAPDPKRAKFRDWNKDLEALRDVLAFYRQRLRDSKPAVKQRLERTLARINAQIANGDYSPRSKGNKPLRDPELEHLEYQIWQSRQALNKRIMALDPFWERVKEHPFRVITQPFREIQGWKSAFDFSALMRQGGIALRSHPIRTLRRMPEAIEAAFNEEKAWKINYELMNGERAWYHHRVGLEFTDYNGALNAREEAFAVSWIESRKYLGAGVRVSNRGFVTLLNMIRADSFDALEASFYKAGGLSLDEGKALATFVNVMTGRGSMVHLEKAAPVLNGLLWSPRFTMSRLQYELGLPLLQRKASWRVRRVIAQEYARYLAGVATTLFLYQQVFGGTIEVNPQSADAFKLKIGNTRLDPLSGLAQWTTLLTRQFTGETKTQKGEIRSLRRDAENRTPFTPTRPGVAWQFTRFKFGFLPGKAMDWWYGENAFGREWSWGREALTAPIPISAEGLLDLLVDQGIPKGLALQTLNFAGEGVNTYAPEESKGGSIRPIRRRVVRRPH